MYLLLTVQIVVPTVDCVDSCTYCRQCRQLYLLQTVWIVVPAVDSVDSCTYCRQCKQMYVLWTVQLYLLQTVQIVVPTVDSVDSCTCCRQCRQLYLSNTSRHPSIAPFSRCEYRRTFRLVKIFQVYMDFTAEYRQEITILSANYLLNCSEAISFRVTHFTAIQKH